METNQSLNPLTGELTQQVDLIDGPSKEALLRFALGEGGLVHVRDNLNRLIHLTINQVGIEDGSRQSWLIWGFGRFDREEKSFTFEGWFRTDRRKGYLRAPQKQ